MLSETIYKLIDDFHFKEILLFVPNVMEMTEPLIKMDWNKTNFKLPFEGFTKHAYPKVIL